VSLRQALDAVRLLDRAGGGEGCRVAIIDTGAAEDASLRGHVNLTNKSITDTEGHGEYVHRIIHRVLPEAEIYLVKVPNPVPDHLFITAIHEAMKWRPHAVNISMGSEMATDGGDPVSIYTDRLASVSVVVCAAGNGGPRPLSVGSPACSRETLAVGAVNMKLRPWSSSSRGPTLDGRFKPDIVAPTGYYLDDLGVRLVGTSFSTPLATSAAALAASILPRPMIVRRLLQLTAQPIPVTLLNLSFIRGQTVSRTSLHRLLRALAFSPDPRNIVGMGLLNAGDTIAEASRLASGG